MFLKVFLKLRNSIAPIAGAIVLAAGAPLAFGAGVAQAGQVVPDGTTYHNILEDQDRSLGWCGANTGYQVTLSSSCSITTWDFTSMGSYGGYTDYAVQNGGDCATVATSKGAHYSLNAVVMEACQAASNQLFINPTNPGNLDSVWGGEHDGCGTEGAPTIWNAAYAGLTPTNGVSVLPCMIDTDGWDIPLVP